MDDPLAALRGSSAARIPSLKLWLLITLPLYIADQATKWFISHRFDLESSHTIIPHLFDLVYYTNTGAAFSFFSSRNSNQMFIIISVFTLGGLLFASWRGLFEEQIGRVALALLVAGILGNLTDRVLHGHVIDFLLVRFWTLPIPPWPAFNVADSCICVAAGLFAIHSLKDGKPRAGSRV